MILSGRPADRWQEASPLGNGRMGAMIYGRTDEELVELSELTFFSGCAECTAEETAAEAGNGKAFDRLRSLIRTGRYAEAETAADDLAGQRGNYGTNLPAGAFYIRFGGDGEPEQYRRKLDMGTGVLDVSWEKEGVRTECQYFLSWPHKLFAARIRRTIPFEECVLRYEYAERGRAQPTGENGLVFHAQALETMHSDGTCGTRLTGAINVFSDGDVTSGPAGIRVKHGREIVVYASWHTDFEEIFKGISGDGTCEAVSETAVPSSADYEVIRTIHDQDIREKMDRVELCLTSDRRYAGEAKEELTAEQLLDQARTTGENRRLTELMFRFGRYLLLCSSREDSPLPAHLQGVWNDDVACRVGWTCDMHLDVNTQMNYWISEAGNLSECHTPLFTWMERQVIPEGRKRAAAVYGLSGWSAELVSNAWGFAAPYWHKSLSPCPACGIWQASDFMDHYRYTQDETFLREHTWPVLREAAEFFLGYLTEGEDGMLESGPSISPENAFLVDGRKTYASMSPTFEVLMIRQLFSDYLECADVLEPSWQETEHGDGMQEMCGNVRNALERLPGYRILADGTLAEWSHDYPSIDPQHRHTSHLLGVYPYHQISFRDTPKLAEAALETMCRKLMPPENWEDTGWARNMLLLYAARLGRGQMAAEHLLQLQEKLTHPGLLVMHPPTRGAGAFSEVYELDGNTGFSMGVAQMLAQGYGSTIYLLPAIPETWKSGSVRGIVAEGGVELAISWHEDGTVNASARARRTGEYRFLCRGEETPVQCIKGTEVTIDFPISRELTKNP